jgi:hypothetical protein
MEGAVAAELKRYDLAIVTAWHTARFVLNGYADKGKLAGNKSLADLLSHGRNEPENTAAQAVSFFRNMQAAGFPVEIKRVVH